MSTVVERERLSLDDSPTQLLRRLRGRPRVVALIGSGWSAGEAVISADPVRELRDWDAVDLAPTPDSHFGGGWIGSWGYRLAGDVPEPPRPAPQPALRVGFYDVVVRRVDGQWWLEWLAGTPRCRIEALREGLASPSEARAPALEPLRFSPGVEEHAAAVRRAIEHIEAGDIFQANVCGRFETRLHGEALDAFCHGVEQLNPAYAAFVADDEGAIASWSPELFLRREAEQVRTSPIKGTAPLTADPRRLTGSSKDHAENVMIVDLMRNDLGRVARPGSVEVPALTRLERHAVWHLVSDVTARVAAPDSALLRATFPPGSVTGAPKIRAMQLLAGELETTAREAYTGAMGYVSPCRGLELNVTIRTLEVAADGTAWIGAGGGIVAASDPMSEVAECFDKVAPIAEAFGVALPDRPAQNGALPAPLEYPSAADPSQGVFTTVLVEDGRPERLAEHIVRLGASGRELYGIEADTEIRRAALTASGESTGTGRLRVELRPDGRVDATFTALDPAPESWALDVHHLPGGLGAHKWIDRSALPDHPALLVGVNDEVLETDRASFFAVFDDGVHTPPLDGRILPGTARETVIDAVRRRGLPIRERPMRLPELGQASEAFAVNALRGIVPVSSIGGVTRWPVPGPVTRCLREPEPEPVPVGRVEGVRLLVVDNEDSFVFNLVQYARELGAEATVVRSTAPLPEISGFTHLLLSPGPGAPSEARTSRAAVEVAVAAGLPVLGVCLGHQVIGEFLGGRVRRAEPVHGHPTLVHHEGAGVLAGLPTPFAAARYHSLVVEGLPDDVEVTARTASGIVMGLRHARLGVEGVQFHPESILTSHGHALLAGFLRQSIRAKS
ncbi:hypothetical protein BHE97_08845 [Aeromicrobium sp. PE09-221]|uniref:chorismate-binding protein n=1 Tax=Aeromicrobium sp. PE09-221 TaxID=1898043 RepID=UPI000B3E4BB7|nr:chorismate-binding protein [Aeromicrobium sp. PE09-221]OUZ10151.1 hypothetical protein BHE97_08845 [Aeromicrobium sp. PE09-221]